MKKQLIAWCMAVGTRAIKTFCQSILSLVTVGQSMLDLNWMEIFWVSLTAAFLSVITSIATGIPEAKIASAEPLEPPIDGELVMSKTKDGMQMGFQFTNALSTLHEGDIFTLKVVDGDTEV